MTGYQSAVMDVMQLKLFLAALQEELQEEDLPKDKSGKMLSTQSFQEEVDKLRQEISDGLIELQRQQTTMMNKFKQDMKTMKSLILELSAGGGRGGGTGSVRGVMESSSPAMEGLQQTYSGMYAQPDISSLPPQRYVLSA